MRVITSIAINKAPSCQRDSKKIYYVALNQSFKYYAVHSSSEASVCLKRILNWASRTFLLSLAEMYWINTIIIQLKGPFIYDSQGIKVTRAQGTPFLANSFQNKSVKL